MGGGVVMEFGSSEEMDPGLGLVGAKDPQISFEFLISSFGLSVGLGVVCSG